MCLGERGSVGFSSPKALAPNPAWKWGLYAAAQNCAGNLLVPISSRKSSDSLTDLRRDRAERRALSWRSVGLDWETQGLRQGGDGSGPSSQIRGPRNCGPRLGTQGLSDHRFPRETQQLGGHSCPDAFVKSLCVTESRKRKPNLLKSLNFPASLNCTRRIPL